jgi:hypothetical protein
MDSHKTWAIIHWIYDNLQMALWALFWAWALYFGFVLLPLFPRAHAIAESQRILEISAENRFYCEKWGVKERTHEYTLCTLDLQEIRANVAQRIAADMNF